MNTSKQIVFSFIVVDFEPWQGEPDSQDEFNP
jgi:hypothetical protein